MKYSIDAGTCETTFGQVEDHVSDASSVHTSMSRNTDSLGTACLTGLAVPITSALNQTYDLSLTISMATAEQQTTNAVAGGGNVVSAIQRGDEQMADNSGIAASEVDEATVQNGKQA